MAGLIEMCGEPFLGDGHADTVSCSLPQWSSRSLDAWSVAKLGMARCSAVKLSEALDVVEGDVVACEVERTVEQHGRVSSGKDETVAVGEGRVGRVHTEVLGVKSMGEWCQGHCCSGMSRVGLLDGVHAQSSDCGDAGVFRGSRCWSHDPSFIRVVTERSIAKRDRTGSIYVGVWRPIFCGRLPAHDATLGLVTP